MVAVSHVAHGPARAAIGRAQEIDCGVDLVGEFGKGKATVGRRATACYNPNPPFRLPRAQQ
jgi:hypothetical protein